MSVNRVHTKLKIKTKAEILPKFKDMMRTDIYAFFYKNIKTEGSLQMFLVFSVVSLKMFLTSSYFVENSSPKL